MESTQLLKHSRTAVTAVLAVAILILFLLVGVGRRRVAADGVLTCRQGAVVMSHFKTSSPWIDSLGVGSYVNFAPKALSIAPQGNAELLRQIRLRQDRDGDVFLPTYTFLDHLLTEDDVGAIVRANPGARWVIGNEMDVDDAVQDATFPGVYARAYHEAYTFIKARDPSAQVGNGALSMMTPGRLQYLDIVWDTYQTLYGEAMPVDFWNMHLYILPEAKPFGDGLGDGKIALGTDPALAIMAPYGADPTQCAAPDVYCRAEHDSITIVAEQVEAMRRWMKAHGQQDKPLILSEVGLLYSSAGPDGTGCTLQDENGACFTPERAAAYLERLSDYLGTAADPDIGFPADENRLVQQWHWYSTVTEYFWSGASSNLLVRDYERYAPGDPAALTIVGRALERSVRADGTQSRLWLEAEAPVVAVTPDTADVVLTARVANNGTVALAQPVTVTFYRDAELTQVIGSQTVGGPLPGCALRTAEARVVWRGVEAGTHPFWVRVDSPAGEPIDPAGDVDRGTAVVLDAAELRQAHLPLVLK